MDIHPGDSELLDVAVRFDTDQDCYGWNNETYFLQPPALFGRNPKWRLGYDRFLVKIVVRSSGHTRAAVFRLINDVPVILSPREYQSLGPCESSVKNFPSG
jgi:hypothetical protein